MRHLTKALFATLILTILFNTNSPAQAQYAGAAPLLNSYFDLLVSGNYESASYLWTREAQVRSSRLGIKYKDIPLKLDCTSPIVQDIELMKNYLQPPVKRYEDIMDQNVQKLYYSAIVNGQSVAHVYFAEYDGRNYWLAYPQDLYSRDWPVRETEYFRLHIHPDLLEFCNGIMFDKADEFVERIGDSLGLKAYDMRHLQASKI